MRNHIEILGILGVLLVGGIGTVRAQPPPDNTAFETLAWEIKPGQKLVVLDKAGHEYSGRLAELSESSIALLAGDKRVELSAADVSRIEKRRTAVWEGLAIGAAAGALLGPTVGRESCLNAPSSHCVAKGMAGLGLTGALLGSLKEIRTTVFESPQQRSSMGLGSHPFGAVASVSVSLRF
jgi:hypothetical protein